VERIALLPRDIYISDSWPPGPGVNRFSGTINDIQYVDDSVRIGVEVGQNKLVAEVPHHVFNGMNLAVGKEVYLILKLRRIRAYDCRCDHSRQ
jgi:ABC-type molybdate transport system ATPase subunit